MTPRQEFILNIFSLLPCDCAGLTPIKVQKLFFLLEKRLGNEAKLFNFQPYLYGPYDREVKLELENLAQNGEIEITNYNGVSVYRPVKKRDVSNFLDEDKRKYIKDNLLPFVLDKGFRELCYAIYKEFPEMKENSVLVQG